MTMSRVVLAIVLIALLVALAAAGIVLLFIPSSTTTAAVPTEIVTVGANVIGISTTAAMTVEETLGAATTLPSDLPPATLPIVPEERSSLLELLPAPTPKVPDAQPLLQNVLPTPTPAATPVALVDIISSPTPEPPRETTLEPATPPIAPPALALTSETAETTTGEPPSLPQTVISTGDLTSAQLNYCLGTTISRTEGKLNAVISAMQLVNSQTERMALWNARGILNPESPEEMYLQLGPMLAVYQALEVSTAFQIQRDKALGHYKEWYDFYTRLRDAVATGTFDTPFVDESRAINDRQMADLAADLSQNMPSADSQDAIDCHLLDVNALLGTGG